MNMLSQPQPEDLDPGFLDDVRLVEFADQHDWNWDWTFEPTDIGFRVVGTVGEHKLQGYGATPQIALDDATVKLIAKVASEG